MILLAMVMVYFVQGKQKFRMHFLHWFLLIFGAIVVILSYVEDYLSFMLQQFTLAQMLGKARWIISSHMPVAMYQTTSNGGFLASEQDSIYW